MKRVLFVGVLLVAGHASAATLSVAPGQSIQIAINAARPGDEIVLTAGGSYTEELSFPEKGGTLPITVRSSQSLPLRRITPSDRALLPSVGSDTVVGARVTGSHWHFVGLAFRSTLYGQGNIIEVNGDATDVVFDRLLIEGGSTGQRRGIALNGRNQTVTRCYIRNMWKTGDESQALAGWNGPGPITITDNYLEASSENILFGGADPSSADRIPSDILVEGNLMTKNLAWKGVPNTYAVKNLFELKNARRVTVRNNRLEHNWVDAQAGAGIVFTLRNSNGTASWNVVEDVLFENNVVDDSYAGFNILGRDDEGGYTANQATRITIRNNLMTNIQTYAIQIGAEAGSITFDHNTFFNNGSLLQMYLGTVIRSSGSKTTGAYAVNSLVMTNNLTQYGSYGVIGCSASIGTATLEACTTSYDFRRNVVAGGSTSAAFPPDTLRPTLAYYLAQFNPDYTLISTSPYKKAGLDGQDLGVVRQDAVPAPRGPSNVTMRR
ncbi:MAG: hypothetical protein ACM36C_02200 [Acidobacteriota bacterium]